jgi:N-methylhydantoinase B/oxoprolinase/acetone carboxylase alpha subunit
VDAGNMETAQAITDALFGALGKLGTAQVARRQRSDF